MPRSVADCTAAEVMAAISAALRAEDMQAVSGLLHVLAVKDPGAAGAILAAVELLSEKAVRERG